MSLRLVWQHLTLLKWLKWWFALLLNKSISSDIAMLILLYNFLKYMCKYLWDAINGFWPSLLMKCLVVRTKNITIKRIRWLRQNLNYLTYQYSQIIQEFSSRHSCNNSFVLSNWRKCNMGKFHVDNKEITCVAADVEWVRKEPSMCYAMHITKSATISSMVFNTYT